MVSKYHSRSAQISNVLSMMRQQSEKLCESLQVIGDEKVCPVVRGKQISRFISFFKIFMKDEKDLMGRSIEVERVQDLIEDQTIATILIEDLQTLDFEHNWNSEIAEKTRILSAVIQRHLRQFQIQYY
jgi:hypothetical protein